MKSTELSLLNHSSRPNRTARAQFMAGNAARLLLAVAFCLSLSSSAVAQSVSGGNPVVAQPNVDTFQNFNILDRNNPIKGTGELTSWSFYAGNTKPVELIIYRGTGNGPFTVVGSFGPVTPTTVGVNVFAITPPITVQTGDLMGFYFPSTGSVEFSLDPPGLSNFGNLSGTILFTANNSGNTTNFVDSSNRHYSSMVTGYLVLDAPFQVSYAANPAAGESYINIINTGANGAALLGPGFGGAAGNICVNVYAFAPDEQEISCCSCLLTPNSVANLGVNRDLTSTTLTGVVPTSVVVKLVATLAGSGGSGTSCSASAAAEGTLAHGLVAYGTSPQPVGTTFSAAERTFAPSTLSSAEYASITGRCASILGNGSGFGICNSCRSGALGADKH
jgi:hypothetical protein